MKFMLGGHTTGLGKSRKINFMANSANTRMRNDPVVPMTASLARTEPEKMTFLIVPRFNMSSVITMIDTLRVANYLAPAALYSWEVVSFDGATITASNGMEQSAIRPPERNRRDELVFVVASWGGETYRKNETLSWIRRQERNGARICAVELGSYLVARAGLAKGIEMASHWSWAPGFHEQFHDIAFREQLFIHDGTVMSCAGAMAGVDLMLKLIADKHGERLAGEIADQMLHHPIRPGTAPQRRIMGLGTDTMAQTVRDAIILIEHHLSEPLSVPEVAKSLGVSQRQLERQFRHNIGCTVVQFSLLQQARRTGDCATARESSAARPARQPRPSPCHGVCVAGQAEQPCHNAPPSRHRCGSETLASAMTIIETAKFNGLNPQAYLTDIFARIHDHKINRIDELLPWNWKPVGSQAAAA